MLKTKRIVITGGAGFIGSSITRSLCEKNEVIVIDNLLTGRYENISDIADSIRFVRDDVNNLDMLLKEFESADYVLHQAALSSVQRSLEDPVTTNKEQHRRDLERSCGGTGLRRKEGGVRLHHPRFMAIPRLFPNGRT